VEVDFSRVGKNVDKGHLKRGILIVIFGRDWEETKPNVRDIRSNRTGCSGHVVCMGGDKIHETFLSEGLKERMLLEGPGLCRMTACLKGINFGDGCAQYHIRMISFCMICDCSVCLVKVQYRRWTVSMKILKGT